MSYSFPGGNGKIVANTRLDISAATVDMGSGTLICSNLEISANAVGVTSSDTSGNQLATLDWVNKNTPTTTVNFSLKIDNKDKDFFNIYTNAPKYKSLFFFEDLDISSSDIRAHITSNDGSGNNEIKLTFGKPVAPLWVKGGGTSNMYHSADGINWNSVSVTIPNAPLTSSKTILWNGFIWVSGGTGTSYSIAWSEDGTDWTGASYSMTTVNKVEWNGSRWVAVGEPNNSNGITIQYSDDGKTWNDVSNSTSHFSSEGLTVEWIDYASKWIAGGSDKVLSTSPYGQSNQIATSVDGISWSNKESGMGGYEAGHREYSCHHIGWNDNIIIAGGGYGPNDLAWSEDNGENWTIVSTGARIFNSKPIWNGEIWTAGTTQWGGIVIGYSSDGKSWNSATGHGFHPHGYTTCWNGDIWVAGGEGGHSLAYSSNGTTDWTGLGKDIFSARCHHIEWTGKLFIARGGGSVNDMAYSYDGTNWTGLGSFNNNNDAFAFNTARANQITFDSNGNPNVTIHKPLTNVSTLEFVLECENQSAVSNVCVLIKG